ncbi:hypothetical protein HDV00_001013 [Rhizophlyctis rosea]|nr:hypothetical protein HDV00_001013 [Rhizophlyctis rosea]
MKIQRLFYALAATATGAHAIPTTYTKAPSVPLSPSAVCLSLSKTLGADKVDFPTETSTYTSSITNIWSSTCIIPPACAVHPSSAQDVAKIITLTSANNTPFAVRAGSHNTNPGAAGTTGVLILLDRLNTITVLDNTKVEVGPGARWGEVYAALDKVGLGVVGGREGGVGVGGLLLAGGISYLSSQYGFAVDNVISYEVVLPNGSIKTVTAASDPDLWFALRGGGNKFGIVTKFTLKAHKQGKVNFGTIFYPEQTSPYYFKSVIDFLHNNKDPKAALIPTYISTGAALGGYRFGILYLFYDAPTVPSGAQDPFAAFKAIPYISHNMTSMPYANATNVEASAGANFFGTRQVSRTVTLEANFSHSSSHDHPSSHEHSSSHTKRTTTADDFASTLFHQVNHTLSHHIHNPAYLIGSIALEPIDLAMLAKHNATGPAAFATPNNGSPQLLVQLQYAWANTTADEYFLGAAKQDIADVAESVAHVHPGYSIPWLYAGYATVDDDPVERVYSGTLGRLRKVQKKVDPKGYFKTLTGGFHI